MAGKLVVFSFGRFNPPTVGHEKLANTVKMAAEKLGASPRIYLSHTQDKKKNPLPYDLKLKYAQAAFGPMVTASNANTIIKVLAELNTEFTDMVFIAGSDRVADFEKLFNEYNGKGDYEFRTIRVISAGERDPDSDGVEGMSASKMRELANAGNLEGFASGLPNKLKPAAATMMKAVRMGLGLTEDLNERKRKKSKKTRGFGGYYYPGYAYYGGGNSGEGDADSGEGMAEGTVANTMSVKDMLAYLKKVMGTESHEDWRNNVIDNNEYFVLKDVPLNSLWIDLPMLDKANVEKYKQMDFSKAPPIVIGSDGNIIDGYHRANVAKALGIKSIKSYVGVKGVAEGQRQQISVQQLATISDEALDNAYHYGRSTPGNTFGWQANLKSAAYAKQMIDRGVTDIEAISDAIHKGWNVTARAFVNNPEQFDDTEKLKAAGKLEAKLQQRAKLMNIGYAQLPDDEQEKDRVVARALLQAINGSQDVAEAVKPTGVKAADGEFYVSDHFMSRVAGRNLTGKKIAQMIYDVIRQHGDKLRVMGPNAFVIRSKEGTGIGVVKVQQPDDSYKYILRTVHPTLKASMAQDIIMVESDDLNIKLHRELNPAIWQNGKLRPEIRETLLKIADDFKQSLGIALPGLRDITISGSNAAYNYTSKSDIDLHLVVDVPKLDQDELYRELFDAKKFKYNAEHNYKIHGYDVELYVQDSRQKHISQGIYSIKRDAWIREPKPVSTLIDKSAVNAKYELIKELIQRASKTFNLPLANKLRDIIKKYRQAGLEAHGEFGAENLAFKALRANGYMDQLYDLLNSLQDREFSIENEEVLDEVSMSPSALSDFAKNPIAQAMTAGFEAEMIVPGLAGDDDTGDDSEPDYDMDEPLPTGRDWRDATIRFFRVGGYNSIGDINASMNTISEDYFEWADEEFNRYLKRQKNDDESNFWDAMREEFDNDTDEMDMAIKWERSNRYLKVIDKLRDEFNNEEDRWEEFLDELANHTSRNKFTYRSFAHRYNLDWPYWNTSEPEGEFDASTLAKNWAAYSGYNAKGSSGYHSASREPGVWIFEPDSSIKGHDRGESGIELVSPPLPLSETLIALDKFWDWADTINAHSNKSTGFHMGVSLPDHQSSGIDHLKLILFLGDKYVLELFNRSNNSYTKSSLEKLKNNVGVINIAALFKEMRKGIDNIALEMFKHLVTPRGDRYLSVNIKSNYIEFRSAGGKYFQARDNIKNTLLRYVRAMAIAADPNAEKQEYAKKLYKLFGSQGLGDVNSIALFSQYAAGTLTKSELVNKVKALRGKQKADAQLATAVTPPAADGVPPEGTPGNWLMRSRRTDSILTRGTDMTRRQAVDGFTRHANVLNLGSNDWYMQPASNTDEAVELDEVNMSPGALRDFAKTPVAQSMKIGFEAEMVVPGIEYDEDDSWGDSEPDYDADEGVDSNTINSLTRDLRMFFRETTSSREVSQAIESLNDDMFEYMDFQFTEMVTDDPDTLAEKVRAQLPDDASDEDVQKSIEEQDAAYDAAFEEWRDEFYSSWDDLPGYIESQNLNTMIGWHERFSWPWPYYEDGGADTILSQESLEKVADSISLALGGVNIKADTDYHAVKRDAVTWILETDSSIKHDPGQGEAGLELVSPPMGLDEGLTKLDQFFAWAERENVTTDRSTGFHMGVSIPNQTLQNIDHLKLILFLGDEHVLQTYGRSSNTYARSSLGIMKDKISGRGVGATIKDVPLMMAKIKQGMNQLAVKSIGDTIVPRGQKYVTVNIKSGYIEFRSAGGNYLEKQDEIKNTLLRYVRAMAIAADPEAEKKEYAKKLYKLLGTTADNDIQDAIMLFSVFSTGLADKSWLVSNLKRIQTARMTPKKTLYTIQDAATGTNTLHSFTTTTDEYAITHAIDWSNNPYSNVDLEKVGWQLVRHDSPNDVKGTVIKKIGGQPVNIPPEFVDVADLDEERLFEISMTPGALKDFAKTPTAQAMTIGFEAEMIVPNLQIDSDEEYDGIMVNDYDRDESLEMNYANWDTMAKRIRRFYRQGSVEDNETIGDAVDKAERSFNSWLDVEWKTYSMTALHDWIAKKYGEDWARQLDFFADPGSSQEDQLAKRRNELAELFRKREYDNWLEKNAEDKDGQTFVDRWLVRKGISTMSEFGDEYGLRWPYMMADPDDQYYKNRISPEDLEANWSEYTGYTSTVSSGYHRGKRQAGVWTFEPDSSIHADDIGFDGIELISPPMPFAEGIEALDTFFKWAKKNRIIANESTGFHMGVSIPNQTLVNIDHLKLILFLGDQHVLKQFGRQANTYTSSSMLQLQQAIKTGRAMINPAKAFDLMRKGLDNQATQALNMIVSTNNRYVSVNIKPNYIEFRAAGGDYFQNINLVKDTLLRYVRAMSIAADPAAENREYAKKLYKLLSADPNNKDLNSMRLFALYATGQIDKATLKSALQAKASKQKASMPITSRTDIPTGSIKYFIYNLATNQILQRFTANSDQEASNYRQAVSNDLNEPDLRVRRDLEDSRDLSKKPGRYILENFTELQIATMLGGHTLE